MKSARHRFAGFAFLAVGLLGHAQGDDRPQVSTLRATLFRTPAASELEFAPSARAPAARAELMGFEFRRDPERDALADLFSDDPPQVTRAELDGDSSAPARSGTLPGGIVLGLRAHPVGSLAGVAGAGTRLERQSDGRLALLLADGRTLFLPFIEPVTLRACLEFVTTGAGSNSLVDLCHERPRFAPSFAGTPLEALLVQQDQVPHRVHPPASIWKSLILDRDVRIEARAAEIVLSADLEVRFYSSDAADSGGPGERSLLTLDLARPEVGDMAAELRPLSGLAAWIGFLRWAASVDPRGLAVLSTSLREPPARLCPELEPPTASSDPGVLLHRRGTPRQRRWD